MDEFVLGRAVEHHGPDFLRQLQLEQQNVPPNSFLHLQRHRPMVPEINDPTFILGVRKFIAKKAHVLFRSVDKTEVSSKSVLGEEDCYAKMPPLETFMGVDPNTCRAHLYHSLQIKDVIVGVVTSILDTGLILNLLCLDHGKNRDIDDLRLGAFVPVKEIPKMFPTQNPVEGYQMKDYIRGVVVSINPETENIILSLMDTALGEMVEPRPTLGLIHEEDFPVEFRRKLHIRGLTFDELLSSICGFTNPGNVPCLLRQLDQAHNASIMSGLSNLVIPEKEYADHLKKTQSQKWAYKSVADGIALFKEGKQTEAMQQLNKALQIDPQNVEALVARGALYANNESYSRALEDFEEAISQNPKHPNGIKYMHDTLLAKGKCLEDEGDWDEAEKCYNRALEIVPKSDEARESLRYVHYRKESKSGRKKDRDTGDGSSDQFRDTADTLRKLIKEEDKRGKKSSKYRRDSSEESDRHGRSSSRGRSKKRRGSSSSSRSRSDSRDRRHHKSMSAKKKRKSGHSRSRSRSRSKSRSRSRERKKSDGDSLYDPSQPTEQTESRYRALSRDDARPDRKDAEYKSVARLSDKDDRKMYQKEERIPFLSDSPARSAEETHTPTKDEVNDRLGLEDISPEVYSNTEDRRLRHLDRKIKVEPKREAPDWSRSVKAERPPSGDEWESVDRYERKEKMHTPSPSGDYGMGKRHGYDEENNFERSRRKSRTPERGYRERGERRAGQKKHDFDDSPERSYVRNVESKKVGERKKASVEDVNDRYRKTNDADEADSYKGKYETRSPPYEERRVISVKKREKGADRDLSRGDGEGSRYLTPTSDKMRSSDRSRGWSEDDHLERRSIMVVSRKDQSRESSESKYKEMKPRGSKSRDSRSRSPDSFTRRSISIGSHSKSKRLSRRSPSTSSSDSRSRSRSRDRRRSRSRDRKRSRSKDRRSRSNDRRSQSKEQSYHSKDRRRSRFEESPEPEEKEQVFKRVIQVTKKKPPVDSEPVAEPDNSIYKSGKWKSIGQKTETGGVVERRSVKADNKLPAGIVTNVNIFSEERSSAPPKRPENKFATYVPRAVKLKQQVHMNPEKGVNPEQEDDKSLSRREEGRSVKVKEIQGNTDKSYDESRFSNRSRSRDRDTKIEQKVTLKLGKDKIKTDPRFKYRPNTPERSKKSRSRSPVSEYKKKYRKSSDSRSGSYDKYRDRSRGSRSRSRERYKRKSRRSRSLSREKYKKHTDRSRSRSESRERRERSEERPMMKQEIEVPQLQSRWDSPEEKTSRWEVKKTKVSEANTDITKAMTDAQESVANMLAASLISSSPPPHRRLKPEEKKALEKKWKTLEVDKETVVQPKPRTIEDCVREAKANIEKHIKAVTANEPDKDKQLVSTLKSPKKAPVVKGLRSRWDSDSSSSSRSRSRDRSRERSRERSPGSRRSRGRRERRSSSSSRDEKHSRRESSSRDRQRSRWEDDKRDRSGSRKEKSDKDEQRVFWFHRKEVMNENVGRGGRGGRRFFRARGGYRGTNYRGGKQFYNRFNKSRSSSSESSSRSPSPKDRKESGDRSPHRQERGAGDNDVPEKSSAQLSELENFYIKLKEDKKKQQEAGPSVNK